MSSAPNVPIEASPDYVYSIDESEDTFIYIPDYGINRAHWDFSNLGQKRIEWLYTPQTILHKVDTPTELDWPWPAELGSHATCVASKAVGRDSGVARHATFVVVKMWPSIAGHAEIFDAIVRDIVVKRRTHHSVVNFSAGSNKRGPVERAHVSGIQELIRRGVPVIVAAGNSMYSGQWLPIFLRSCRTLQDADSDYSYRRTRIRHSNASQALRSQGQSLGSHSRRIRRLLWPEIQIFQRAPIR